MIFIKMALKIQIKGIKEKKNEKMENRKSTFDKKELLSM